MSGLTESLPIESLTQSHLAYDRALNKMTVYILGCQPKIADKHSSDPTQSKYPHEPNNVNATSWSMARLWLDYSFNLRGEITDRDHLLNLIKEAWVLAHQVAVEEDLEEPLNIPNHFHKDLTPEEWMEIELESNIPQK